MKDLKMKEAKPRVKWYKNPVIPMALAAAIFGTILLSYMGIIDLPHFGSDGINPQPGGCPITPDPPCWSVHGDGDIPANTTGVYVYDYCKCPNGTEYYTTVGSMHYCQCT